MCEADDPYRTFTTRIIITFTRSTLLNHLQLQQNGNKLLYQNQRDDPWPTSEISPDLRS